MAGEGSIYPRTRLGPSGKPYIRYVAQLSSGPRGANRVLRRSCRTRAEARQAIAEMRAELAGVALSRQPLGAYLRWWLTEVAAPSVSPNTIRGYEDAMEHLRPIAAVPVAGLTPEHIEQTLNRMTSRHHGQKEARPAAPKTIRNVQLMLRAALGDAELRGHVYRNPARLVPLRRVPSTHRDALTPDGAAAILEAVKGDRYESAYALAMVGLRVSEILGLAWSEVTDDTVRVIYQIVGSGPSAARAQLKSRASKRTVHLPPFVRDRLDTHRQAQRRERIAAGIPTEEGLVFTTPTGFAVNGSWFTKHFQSLLAASGLTKLRVHDLRHGAATLMAAEGVHPSVAQRVLGHSSSRTTLEVYTHATEDQQREAMERVGESVRRATGRATGRGNNGRP